MAVMILNRYIITATSADIMQVRSGVTHSTHPPRVCDCRPFRVQGKACLRAHACSDVCSLPTFSCVS